jgi:protein O-mannosyl-transferase
VTTSLSMSKAWLILAIVTTAALLPTLRQGFIYDDHKIIEQNARLRAWTAENLRHDFTSNVFDDSNEDPYYRPFLTIIDRVDYTLGGLHPAGYHLTNLLFHLGTVLLFYQLLLALGLPALTSLIAAMLFAVHPANIDLFLLVTARGEQMAFFFTLAACLGLLANETPWALTLASYALALLSKESALIAPLLAALLFWYRREPLARYARLVPLVLLSIPYLWLWHRAIGALPALSLASTRLFVFRAFPRILWSYAALVLVPVNLHFPRHMSTLSHFWGLYLAAFLLLWSWLLMRRLRLGLFCLAWFTLSLAPKIPAMVTQSFRLDHWGYAAMPGILIPFAILITRGLEARQKALRVITKGGLGAAVIGCTFLCHFHANVRGSDEKAIRWAMRYEDLASLHFKLGVLLWREGRASEAVPELQVAYIREPELAVYGNALALAIWDTGRRSEALTFLQGVARRHPDDTATQGNWSQMQKRNSN